LNIVVGGHVDHGKSTIVGRLLADTGSLPQGKLEQVRALCERTARPFEYAFLLDALRDERAQGITIDAARVFFNTPRRHYTIIDAPGHIEFLKNLVTGAARAEAALLVIDAGEGIRENSRRHAYMMSLLGIRHLVVLVNKMDLVGFDRQTFESIEHTYREFLDRLDVRPAGFIPVSGRDGDNVASRSASMPWYGGPTVLEVLDRFPSEPPDLDRPFRLPVQDVYKFTADNDTRRIVAGTVASGTARVGDEIVFHPSGKKGVIEAFEAFNRPRPEAVAAGEACGFTLRDQIYVARGDVACLASQDEPAVTTRFRASLFWLGREPLVTGKDYALKIGSTRVPVCVESIDRVIDGSDLSVATGRSHVERHEVADCVIAASRAIAFDTADRAADTSRFVIVDDFEIAGGGIIREPLADRQTAVREKVLLRNYKWAPSGIASERRVARLSQRPTLLLISGPAESDRKGLARALEARLFDEGRTVYFLGIGNLLYGVDADIARDREHRHEHVRRLAEVANLMLDAGMILIVTALELTREDLDLINTSINSGQIETVWIGDATATDFPAELQVPLDEDRDAAVARLCRFLEERGVFPGGEPTAAWTEPPPVVLWFTGLSGSGKSTIAHWVADRLRRRGAHVEQLDGDTVRNIFPNTGFTRDARDAHIKRVGYLASRLEQNGVSVVASFVSPYEDARAFVRGLCRNFVQIHVATPLEVCEARDAKGLYARARRGEIRNFTGIDDPYEPPVRPDLVVDTSGLTVEEAGGRVLDLLRQRFGKAWD
jgi:bifunctional enzyme CysN/CysC